MANKTVYPIPGIHLPGIESKEQSVDETWAAELVASGAFRYTDFSAEDKQGLVDQEVKRVMDAQQSDAGISLAKMEAKLAKIDSLPEEAKAKAIENPPAPAEPRAIAGVDPKDITDAIGKASKPASDAKTAKPADQTGGLQVTK